MSMLHSKRCVALAESLIKACLPAELQPAMASGDPTGTHSAPARPRHARTLQPAHAALKPRAATRPPPSQRTKRYSVPTIGRVAFQRNPLFAFVSRRNSLFAFVSSANPRFVFVFQEVKCRIFFPPFNQFNFCPHSSCSRALGTVNPHCILAKPTFCICVPAKAPFCVCVPATQCPLPPLR